MLYNESSSTREKIIILLMQLPTVLTLVDIKLFIVVLLIFHFSKRFCVKTVQSGWISAILASKANDYVTNDHGRKVHILQSGMGRY